MKESKNGYYIMKSNPTEKVVLRSEELIDLFSKELIELVIPQGCKKVYCSYSSLTKLIIPEGVEFISCIYNFLTELIIPNGCKFISCHHNNLNKLILPMSCEEIYCYNNNLHPIVENLFHSWDPVKIQLANSLQLTNNSQK
jgi:hypothetical protein